MEFRILVLLTRLTHGADPRSVSSTPKIHSANNIRALGKQSEQQAPRETMLSRCCYSTATRLPPRRAQKPRGRAGRDGSKGTQLGDLCLQSFGVSSQTPRGWVRDRVGKGTHMETPACRMLGWAQRDPMGTPLLAECWLCSHWDTLGTGGRGCSCCCPPPSQQDPGVGAEGGPSNSHAERQCLLEITSNSTRIPLLPTASTIDRK